MPVTTRKFNPPSDPSRDSAAPVAALERPQNLKKWSAELVGILKREEKGLFEGWDFGPGSLTRMDFTRILKKISGCGSVVELRAALNRETGEIGRPAVHAANYCGQHTICPYCAGRVQDRRGARFRDSIQAMSETYPFAYMVTATIPPAPTWREDLDKLINGWQSFRRMGQIRRRKKKDGTVTESRSGGEWGKVRAGIAKIELKRGEGSKLPHCHYHALIFTNDQIDFRLFETEREKNAFYAGDKSIKPLHVLPDGRMTTKINFEWFRATDGTATNLRVDPIKYRKADAEKGRSWAESVFDQSREVLKYATKFDSHPETGAEKLFARDFIGIRDATYNRRLFVTYGDFRKVGGSDFAGGGPHISESPLIFESRWRGFEYSPLMERSRPIFPNTDKTPFTSERLSILNGVQGQIRRMRFAILRSKKHFRETGELRPAFFMRQEIAEDGGHSERPAVLEPPEAVALSPRDPATWETWMDSVMEQGRDLYSAAKETLSLVSLERLDGTPAEREAIRYSMARAWRESSAYADHVAKLFRDTLNQTRPASSPAP